QQSRPASTVLLGRIDGRRYRPTSHRRRDPPHAAILDASDVDLPASAPRRPVRAQDEVHCHGAVEPKPWEGATQVFTICTGYVECVEFGRAANAAAGTVPVTARAARSGRLLLRARM